jgi:hypothetical protein
MKDFKTLPKMKTGGRVKKYEEGGEVSNTSEAYRLYDNKEKAFVTQKNYASQSSANKVAENKNKDFGSHRYSAEKYSDIVRMKTPPQPSTSGGGGGGGAGGAGGLKNLLDPDSPLNRKTGGKVKRGMKK